MRLIKNLWAPKIWWTLAGVYSVLLTVLLLLPSGNLPSSSVENLDKIGHISLNFLLMMVWLVALFVQNENISRFYLALISILVLVYGIIIEFLQQVLTFSRKAEIFDVFANSFGILLALLAFLFIVKPKITNYIK